MRTAICELFDIEYPVIQGGMAWLGTAELASAVSNGGGLGLIGAGNAPPSWVREQIRLTRERTDKPFGVNIMLMSPFVEEVIEVVLEEGVPIVATGGGNPGIYIPRLKEAGMKVMPVVSSVALAKRLERAGADAIVAEGMESGGHVGETTTMALVPQVVDGVDVPVVAAGGISDGRGLAAALSLGAQGVQMGTRFVCAEECIAHINFKKRIIEARDRATVVSGYATGHPVRCLENKMTRQFMAMEKGGASVVELERFGEGKLQLGVLEGDMEHGSLMAGQIAGLVREIKPASAIIREIVEEAEAIIAKLGNSYVGVSHG
jgi:enoyl-[acyl-carrier protein] reductase II